MICKRGYNLDECNFLESNDKKQVKHIKEMCDKYGVTEIIALRRTKEIYILRNFKSGEILC